MNSKPPMKTSRRRCLAALAALAPMTPRRATALGAAEQARLVSKAYRFADLKESTSGGNSFWAILHGKTWAGCPIEVHETKLAQGGMPHPPHHHAHEEMFLIREGQVEVTIAGRSTRLGPGSAAYVASNEEHSIKNVGSASALYFVLAVGNES